MFTQRFTVAIFFVAIIIAATLLDTGDAYRKPPFNGSIFGKRNIVEYDNAKAITALCEIAVETCQSWLPQAENK